MAQTLGVVDIVWKGTKLSPEKGASFKFGGLQNTPVIAGRQVHRAEEMQACEVKATIPLTKDLDLDALLDRTEGELQFVCDTGQTFTMPEAFITGKPTVTGGEGGKMEFTWSAGEYEETTAS